MKMKNPKSQFEYHSDMFNKHIIKEAYQWCLDNLPLKSDRGIIFNVDKLFIITSSQKIVDKLNKNFGSSFTFNNKDFWNNRTYFLKP